VSAPVSLDLGFPFRLDESSSPEDDDPSARNDGDDGGSEDRVKKTTFARDPPI